MFSFSVFAADKVEMNSIVFSAHNKSYTYRDYKLYQRVLTNLFKKKKISAYSQDGLNDFILSRLAESEADSFDLSFDQPQLADSQKLKLGFDLDEVNAEVRTVAKSLSLIDIKESNHKDLKRFSAWYDVMKRKYLVKVKATNFKETF